ncbi:aldehyde dehydrogenase family protein [Pseudomonas citronellolis]|uniref:aldehyde dehydrogenase family protein n=1 Tax=Pseudomonas citronellolis TaxID=53408 RepID=UPI0018D7B0A8|nr:aldehyde dehydrogenase family protein [Pseudomonas citronellolis]MBH3434074.1 aldehyde dehydrogenase family protein [Pseudomonas citronellolis]
MAFIERETPGAGDAAQIAELQRLLAAQRRAFLAEPMPSLAQRLALLGTLANMLLANRTRIQEAIASDFGSHPRQFADLVECLGVAGRAQYAAEHLVSWMKPQARALDPALYGSANAYVQPQPKGVIGNMAPWNFPFDIGLGPVVEMLAAGNRVIVKPSDLAPACSELLLEMLASHFDAEQLTAVAGGLDLARAFAEQPWDHLMYTGSTEVGRQVAVAAAHNLVPVTLELGGKCPAIIAPGGLDEAAVEQIVGCKTIKNGQMCVTVDYVLVHEDDRERFVQMVGTLLDSRLPGYASRADTTGIINARHLQRLLGYLDDARARGASLVQFGGEAQPQARRLPFTLALDVDDGMQLMQREIFGPILPVLTYRELDQAIAYVNAHERPLGIYVFSAHPASAHRVLGRTVSGGACINCAALQAAVPSLPFGGIGKSGSGRHHGHEGFLEFSNLRAVGERGQDDLVRAMFAPYGELADALIAAATGG